MTVHHQSKNPTLAGPRPPYPKQSQPYPGLESKMRRENLHASMKD